MFDCVTICDLLYCIHLYLLRAHAHAHILAVLDNERNVALKDCFLLPAVLLVGFLDYTWPRREERIL
jgi:hypothetical protein